ncbi:MAG: 2'-5' RNA ligase family protein, partial [Trebonia sp.]
MTHESALLVAVPAAESAVARHRSRLDTSAAVGVPAHITVLYPFLPPDLIDADTHATLARLFASVPGFPFTLDQTRWFPDPVLWLGPSDTARFSALTALVAAAFPSCPHRGHPDDRPATGLRAHRCPLDDGSNVLPRLVASRQPR